MQRSRATRAVGFALSLIATALLVLANGFSIVLCAEPDGCIELEFVAAGDAPDSGCVDHEHEVGSALGEQLELSSGCPCEDTVFSLPATSASARPAKLKLDDAAEAAAKAPPPSMAIAFPPFAQCEPRDGAARSQLPSARTAARLASHSPYSRGSVVLRS